jgi:hypothetical protein
MRSNSSAKRFIKAALLLAASLRAVSGCTDAEEFRAAAGDSIHTGLSAIADGLLNGIFAVVEPDATSDTDSSSTAE